MPKHKEVYALYDPRDNLARYVGISWNAYHRFRDHLQLAKADQRLYNWIRELLSLDLQPELKIVVRVPLDKFGYPPTLQAYGAEKDIIRRLLTDGHPLFNVDLG